MMQEIIESKSYSLVFVLFILTTLSFRLCLSTSGGFFCPEAEKAALLSFKQSIIDTSNVLSSWTKNVDCCMWERVVCSNLTGRVHELHLEGSSLASSIGGANSLNPSLLNLTELRYLSLSGNDFGGTIPSFIGSLASLEYLDLSEAGFYGAVPHTIGNLSSLRTLKLGSLSYQETLVFAESLEWLQGLSRLQHAEFSNVDLSKATDWVQVVNSLPSLLELCLSQCRLDLNVDDPLHNISTSLAVLDLSFNKNYNKTSLHPHAVPKWIFRLGKLRSLDLSGSNLLGPFPSIANFTNNLEHLDLYDNSLDSTIPDWLYSCNHLVYLDLSFSKLKGVISNALGNMTSLKFLDLSFNELSGEIPREISKLCRVHTLNLAYNELRGNLSGTFGTISDCLGGVLQYLKLNGNKLSGHLTSQFFAKLKSLRILDLRINSLSGPIPSNIGEMTSLEELYLTGNKFTENFPESFGQLFNLKCLFLAENMLKGVVTETHLTNLTKLQDFRASGNNLTLDVSPHWIPPFRLRYLNLGSWNIEHTLSSCPEWLQVQKDTLMYLNLSNTGISFQIPTWAWKIFALDLSHNKLHGQLDTELDGVSIYLGSNQFTGPLPRIPKYVLELDLSKNAFSGGLSHFLCDTTYPNLAILNLGGNMLSGELPDCWTKLPLLRRLNLTSNNLSGDIPHSIGALTSLMSLNLYNNSLTGPIPSSLQNCTNLVKIDLSENKLSGNIPPWMGASLVNLRILVLRSNKLIGRIPQTICYLNSLHILDLSDNKLSGTIPRCVDNFTALATTNESHYDYLYDIGWHHFSESSLVTTKGITLEYDVVLPLVKIIDLSHNSLSGAIPEQLTSLVELKSLNLSSNHFAGTIPSGIGQMKQLESLDLSRNSLSGEIPDSLALLSYLSYINLSYNNLTGEIPHSTQLQLLQASSFIGNNLCGLPLPRTCTANGNFPDLESEGANSNADWFFIFLSSGYVMGFSVVISVLIFNKSWRNAYFGFLEDIWDKL